MKREDRRAALEAIAYGDDSELRPSDRLRAIEMLEEASNAPACPICVELREVSDEQLNEWLKAFGFAHERHVADSLPMRPPERSGGAEPAPSPEPVPAPTEEPHEPEALADEPEEPVGKPEERPEPPPSNTRDPLPVNRGWPEHRPRRGRRSLLDP
jgi:hypothetical protein